MKKQEFMVFWNGEEWIGFDQDQAGEFEEVVDFSGFDKTANGFKWSMSYKQKSQRKWRNSSAMTQSIYAMLDSVKDKLKEGNKVFCQTPDIVIHFRAI